MRRRLGTGVVLAAVLSLASGFAPQPAGAIYGGKNVDFDAYRWMVSIREVHSPDQHSCGGTLIAPDMVLTGAHCVNGHGQHDWVAVVGVDVSDWSDPHKAPRIPVLGWKAIKKTPNSNKDDIAVLRLASRQSGPTIRLATNEPRVGREAVAAGWGCPQKPPACSGTPGRLKVADQVVIADGLCGPSVFHPPLFYGPSAICTKGSGGASTVNGGDSGGPLLLHDGHGGFVEVGVTSLKTDDPSKLYSAFTSVPHERAWINSAMEALRG